MRLKIGNDWYEAKPGHPIMIEFDTGEKLSVARMPTKSNRLAHFVEDKENKWTKAQRLAWMNEGAKVQTDKLYRIEPIEEGWYEIAVTKRNEMTIDELKKEIDLED